METVETNEIVDLGRSIGRRFELKVHIAPKFYPRIIGSQGNTRRRLEQETNTHIVVPRIGSRSSNIIVRGDNNEDILNAKQRLEQMTKPSDSHRQNFNARRRLPKQNFSHFLSVSFATDEFKSNFLKFRDDLMMHSEKYGLHESMFQKPEKLHITIVMLVLNDEQTEAIAFDHLKECKEAIIDPVLKGEPLVVKASGVEIFSDCKPTAVNVVFGKVESEPLQKISNEVAKYFENRGLIKLDRDEVALHLTLVNTSLYKSGDDGDDSEDKANQVRQIKRKPFDATEILEKYKDFYFGSLTVDEIHVSRLHAKVENSYYESAGILKL